MEYKGKLYGKVNKSYFPLLETTDDIEKWRSEITRLKADIEKHKFSSFPMWDKELLKENEGLKAEITRLKDELEMERNRFL